MVALQRKNRSVQLCWSLSHCVSALVPFFVVLRAVCHNSKKIIVPSCVVTYPAGSWHHFVHARLLFVANVHLKASMYQIIKNLQRENDMISTAWYDLINRLQSNHVVLQRRYDAPKSWLHKQRHMIDGALAPLQS